jgi:hypothetical protein
MEMWLQRPLSRNLLTKKAKKQEHWFVPMSDLKGHKPRHDSLSKRQTMNFLWATQLLFLLTFNSATTITLQPLVPFYTYPPISYISPTFSFSIFESEILIWNYNCHWLPLIMFLGNATFQGTKT